MRQSRFWQLPRPGPDSLEAHCLSGPLLAELYRMIPAAIAPWKTSPDIARPIPPAGSNPGPLLNSDKRGLQPAAEDSATEDRP